MAQKGVCDTPSCENEVLCVGLCKACYSSAWYWRKRPLKAIMARKQQLVIISERMDHLRPKNVVVMDPRRRAAAAAHRVRPAMSA